MYLEHFGLREWPFAVTPSPRFAVDLPAHREAIAVVCAALAQGDGFVSLIAEVGVGKSLLAQRLLALLSPQHSAALVPNPALTPGALIAHLAHELGVPTSDPRDERPLVLRLGAVLDELSARGRSAVAIVDEAQALPDASLEALRLLGNLERDAKKLVQIVLLAQPELDARLARPKLRQLRQRIVVRHELRPLRQEEVEFYVDRRLRRAGGRGERLFEESALRALRRASRGVPRLVNVLAHKALLAACAEGSLGVKRAHVARAIADTPDARRRSRVFPRLRARGAPSP
jgi:MSHA biogenesis protein MshM